MTVTPQPSVAADLTTDDTQKLSLNVTADMIASNTVVGVAPDPAHITVIDEIYAFAEKLRG